MVIFFLCCILWAIGKLSGTPCFLSSQTESTFSSMLSVFMLGVFLLRTHFLIANLIPYYYQDWEMLASWGVVGLSAVSGPSVQLCP